MASATQQGPGPAASEATSRVVDLGRRMMDEQIALVRRWGKLAECTTHDAQRLVDGEIDTIAFGRELASQTIREGVHAMEVAARFGMDYYEYLVGIVDPRRARTDQPDEASTETT